MADNKHELKKFVRKSLAETLTPLKFCSASTGYFRRKLESVIHVVNVAFYTNPSEASRYSCSKYAFTIEVGIFYNCIPFRFTPIKGDNPHISDCVLRKFLSKTIEQPSYLNRLIWSADDNLSNLPAIIIDAKTAIKSVALPWYDNLSNLQTAFEVITTAREDNQGGTWGQGMPHSPIQSFYGAFLANALGKDDEADEYFLKFKRKNEKLSLGYDIDRLEREYASLRSQNSPT